MRVRGLAYSGRLWNGLKLAHAKHSTWIGIAAPILGGIIFSVKPVFYPLLSLSGIFVLAVYHSLLRAPDEVPDPALVFDGDDFEVAFPSPLELEEATAIAARAFPAHRLNAQVIGEILRIDPRSCIVARDKFGGGRVVGYLDFYALHGGPTLEKFKLGRLSEDDLRSPDFTNLSQVRSGGSVYIAGFVIEETNRLRKARICREMILRCLIILRVALYSSSQDDPINFIAVPYTRAGRQLIDRLPFQVIVSSGSSVDGHPRYEATLSERSLRLVYNAVREGRTRGLSRSAELARISSAR